MEFNYCIVELNLTVGLRVCMFLLGNRPNYPPPPPQLSITKDQIPLFQLG